MWFELVLAWADWYMYCYIRKTGSVSVCGYECGQQKGMDMGPNYDCCNWKKVRKLKACFNDAENGYAMEQPRNRRTH